MRSISLILLFYNNEQTVKQLVNDARLTLELIAADHEIIAVNDCSSDGTAHELDKLKKLSNIRIVNNERNLGVGASFRQGILNSTKEFIAYTDGDYQYNVSDLASLAKNMGDCEVVSGYRSHRSEGWYRATVSRHYNFLLGVFFGLKLKDANSSLKIYRADKLFAVRHVSDFAFYDAEVLIKLQADQGCRIKEVPVRHFRRNHGTSAGLSAKNMMDVLRAFQSEEFARYRKRTLTSSSMIPWIYFLRFVVTAKGRFENAIWK